MSKQNMEKLKPGQVFLENRVENRKKTEKKMYNFKITVYF